MAVLSALFRSEPFVRVPSHHFSFWDLPYIPSNFANTQPQAVNDELERQLNSVGMATGPGGDTVVYLHDRETEVPLEEIRESSLRSIPQSGF